MPFAGDRPPPTFVAGDRVRVEFGTARGRLGEVVRIFLHPAQPKRDLIVVRLLESNGHEITVSVYPGDLERAT